MKKIELTVTEKLTFTRKIDVLLPNEMSEATLHIHLDGAERAGDVKTRYRKSQSL